MKNILRYIQTILFRGAGAISTIALTLIVSRGFVPEEARDWFVALNIITIAGTCLRWGIDEVIVRRLAKSDIENKSINIAACFIIKTFRITIPIFALASIALLYQGQSLISLNIPDLMLIIFSTMLASALMAIGRIFQGVGKLNWAAFYLTICTPLTTAGAVAYWSTNRTISKWDEIVFIYGCTSFAFVAIACIQLWMFNRKTPHVHANSKNFQTYYAEDRRSANILALVVIATQALPWTTISIVPYYFSAATTNLFIVSQKLTMAMSLIALVINFAISHKIAKLFHQNDSREIRSVFFRGLGVIITSCAIVAFLTYLFSTKILNFSNIVGENAQSVLMNMLLSQIFFGISTYCALFLTMSGKESKLLKMTATINFLGAIGIIIACGSSDIKSVATTYNLTYLALSLTLGLYLIGTTLSEKKDTVKG